MAETSNTDLTSRPSSPTSARTSATEEGAAHSQHNERLEWTFPFAQMLPVDAPLPSSSTQAETGATMATACLVAFRLSWSASTEVTLRLQTRGPQNKCARPSASGSRITGRPTRRSTTQ